MSQTQGCSCRLYLFMHSLLHTDGAERDQQWGAHSELTSSHSRNELALRRAHSLHNCGSVHSLSVQGILLLETEFIISAFFCFPVHLIAQSVEISMHNWEKKKLDFLQEC